MSVEIEFPVEFVVEGVPVSLQASPGSRERWKARVSEAAKSALPEGHWVSEGPVSVAICYFPDGQMAGDLDNILKPILDAMAQMVYVDDQQVERIVVQKFESGRTFSFENPSPKLLEAAGGERPLVYVRVDSDTGIGDE